MLNDTLQTMQLAELSTTVPVHTYLNAGILDVVVAGSSAEVCSMKCSRVVYVPHHLSFVQGLGSRGDQIEHVLL